MISVVDRLRSLTHIVRDISVGGANKYGLAAYSYHYTIKLHTMQRLYYELVDILHG